VTRSTPLVYVTAGREAIGFVLARGRLRGRNCILIERTPMMDRAPAATVEALMYSLRRGIEALAVSDNKRRLSGLSEEQLRAICHQLRNFKPEIAPAWTLEEVEALVIIWSELK
jgi:hypothetical protein